MTGATSPRIEWNRAFIDADYEMLESFAAFRTTHPSPHIEITTAVGKRDQSATRPDGWTVVVALNTVGSSEPTR